MNTNVLSAIFRRNFVAYFTSPTGYVFICLFMLVSSAAAFIPHAFFNANLANLDQLNEVFPWIMLVFIPTITMSIWADERRQGTDELLLTIPAADIDVVLGKYLAAVAIYAVSLAFSFVSNWIMLSIMGDPDLGLFVANYIGYLLVGLAMLAIGMIGSFLTGNLTVAFIFGVLLNFPLVVLSQADVIVANTAYVPDVSRMSIAYRLADFGRGVISLSSTIYFLTIAAAAIYVCLILIGRRHWLGGRDGHALLGHYVVRAFAVAVATIGVIVLCSSHDLRADATMNRTNTLSAGTEKILARLHDDELRRIDKEREDLVKQKEKQSAAKDDAGKEALEKINKELANIDRRKNFVTQPVLIEAYVSRNMPEAYMAKRVDLEAKLREFENLAGGKIKVAIHEVEPYSDRAKQAEEKYGIKARTVLFRSHGAVSQDKIFLGAAFVHGTSREVIKFFELGIPVEYELVRSIATVAQQQKKTLGVIDTLGGDMSRAFGGREQGMLAELEKQFKVETISPSSKIELVDPKDPDKKRKYDVLLLVQPSQLGPDEMRNVVEAIRSGVPTAIFEDPLPLWSNVPGTSQPRRAPSNPMMPFQPPQEMPKGDINELWDTLGVTLRGQVAPPDAPGGNLMSRMRGGGGFETLTVWQNYNPYRQLRSGRQLTNGFIFVRNSAPGADGRAFGDDALAEGITKGLFELLFIYPGAIQTRSDAPGSLKVARLVTTGDETGIARTKDVTEVIEEVTRPMFGEEQDLSELPYEMRTREIPEEAHYILAARIKGKPAPSRSFNPLTGEGADKKPEPPGDPAPIDVVLVADIDMLNSRFFELRARPDPDSQNQFQFQNVAFVLNVLDALAGDERYLDIRKRREHYGTLTGFEAQAEKVRQREEATIAKAAEEFNKTREQAANEKSNVETKWTDDLAKIEKSGNQGELLAARYKREMEMIQAAVKETKSKEQARRKRNTELNLADDSRERETRELEFRYKAAAVFVPPIPPLILALVVYLYRRSLEKEGVAKSRLR